MTLGQFREKTKNMDDSVELMVYIWDFRERYPLNAVEDYSPFVDLEIDDIYEIQKLNEEIEELKEVLYESRN